MRIKSRLFWVIFLFIPLYLDVASCGPRPKYDVNIYTYENGEFLVQDVGKLSRYQRIHMKAYDVPEVEGYTFLGWFEPQFKKNQSISIENYIDVYLNSQEDGKIRPEMVFTIYVKTTIYPILIQTEKLDDYIGKIRYEVEYCTPRLPSSGSYSILIEATYGDKISDIVPNLESIEGYTFVGYANIAITPEEYETIGIPKENRLELTTPIDYQFPTIYDSTYKIYPIYQKNK